MTTPPPPGSSRTPPSSNPPNSNPAGGFSFSFGSATGPRDARSQNRSATGGVEGILSGLGGLLAKLGELAERGQELRGSVGDTDAKGRETAFHYGVSVRTLNDGRDVKVEPFGNLRRDDRTGETSVEEVREPLCDVFEETGHVLVVLEMPGVAPGEINAELAGDILTVHARNARKHYRKEILLPAGRTYDPASMPVSANSGVVEIRLATRAA